MPDRNCIYIKEVIWESGKKQQYCEGLILNPAVTRARRHISANKRVNVTSLSQKKDENLQHKFARTSLFFSSPRTIFTKAENVTMGTHYQATSVAWHDAQ